MSQSPRPRMRKIVAKKLYTKYNQDSFVLTQPLWVRIFHWGFAISTTMVVLSGLVLHKPLPFLAFNFGHAFIVHIASAFVALGFIVLRFADMLIRKDSSLILKLSDIKSFPNLMAYYLFIKPSPPPGGKYNSGQKLIFNSWLVVFLVASFFGIASYQINDFKWVLKLTGGFQGLRFIKYTAAIYFAATIPVHLYLSFTENPSRLQAMVSGYERVKPKP